MKRFFLRFLSTFTNKKDTEVISIQELNDLRQKERKFQLARKSREYISELNKKQRLWIEKNRRKSRKAS